jgi:hypothetical protein
LVLAVSVIAQAADESEAGSTRTTADSSADELATAEQETEAVQEEIAGLRTLAVPGMAEALQGAYLRLIQAGCEDPSIDVETLIEQESEAIAANSDLLASTDGWEEALDRDELSAAIAACESS